MATGVVELICTTGGPGYSPQPSMSTTSELSPIHSPANIGQEAAPWSLRRDHPHHIHRGVPPWSPLCYATGRQIGRGIFGLCIRSRIIRPEIAERQGSYILALTHLGNLDPFVSGVLIRRRLRWMTRKEFFKYRLGAWVLRKVGCFSVNRQGIPVSAIRRAIAILETGQVVAICPEGGRTRGAESAVRGGRIKRGVCSIAIRSGAPVVPCAMLGTEQLNRAGAWLPLKRTRLEVAYGKPISPPTGPSTRAKRDLLRRWIEEAYMALYDELGGETPAS